MTFRKLVGLAAIGGLIYAHKKRGGQMTLESFKQSGRDLIEGIKGKAQDLRSEAESRLHDVASNVSDATEKKGFSSDSKLGQDVTGYGSSGYGYSGSSSNRRS